MLNRMIAEVRAQQGLIGELSHHFSINLDLYVKISVSILKHLLFKP